MTECSSRRLVNFSCVIEGHFRRVFLCKTKQTCNQSIFYVKYFRVFRSNDDHIHILIVQVREALTTVVCSSDSRFENFNTNSIEI